MPLNRKVKPTKRVIPLDGDKLGMIGGMVGAIIVLIISLLLQRGDLVNTLIRMGGAFVVCYGSTFFLIRVILRTTLQEMIEQDRLAKATGEDEEGEEVPEEGPVEE